MRKIVAYAISFGISFVSAISAQSVIPSSYNSISEKVSAITFLPLSEVKEGMRGKARTVFRGTEPEEFDVEILGVLPNAVGPQKDLIIGKIGGNQVERTAVFAGMSGSPVFIDGKLIGAISYSFPFSKEPICGITPIEQMVNIFSKAEDAQPSQTKRIFSESEIDGTKWQLKIPTDVQKALISEQAFQPISTPVAFSGFSSQTLEFFSSQLKSLGLLPVASVGGSNRNTLFKKYDEKTLQPGSSVAMELTRGDYSITAYGTVTFRDGENVYAFGHQFLNLGISNLPMSESKVVAIVPSIYNSFKLAVSEATVGTMTQDRSTGVLGKLGQEPKMIPVEIILKTSRGKVERVYFEIVEDSFLTPLLLNITVYNAIISNERMLGEATIELSGNINIQNQPSVRLERKFTGNAAVLSTANAVAAPVNLLLQSGFGAKINNIKLQISFKDGEKAAILEKVSLNRIEASVGDTLEIQAFLRTSDGKQLNHKIMLEIPQDLPGGRYALVIGDGSSIQQILPENLFMPKNLEELIQRINKVKKTDRIYVFLTKQSNGALIGVKELPNLPPSALATLGNVRSIGQAVPMSFSILMEKESEKLEYTVSGQKSLVISIKN